MVGIIADLPNLTPGAMGFSRLSFEASFAFRAITNTIADLANHWEARLVDNKWYRKAIWLMLFPFFQLTRPTPVEGHQDVGPVVLCEFCVRGGVPIPQLFTSAGGPDFCILRSRFLLRLGCTL